MSTNHFLKNRGNRWDFDRGPAKGTSYARIFSQTPNYRGLSKEALGREKFRNEHGPMFCRGCTKKNGVKILIIGQEGAQDECLSHRSFTGGTGGRMQHFLNFLGIDRSYLFLNTFVYPIYGQYDDKIRWLAQNENSPIVQHRHKLFNYVVKINKVDLIVAVGLAAKESVKSWIESTGGTCPDGTKDLSTSTGGFLSGTKTKVVGVMHPGGAGKGGSVTKIKASFLKVIQQVKQWHSGDNTWLEVDPGSIRDFDKIYKYSSKPIPCRDFPLGFPLQLGRKATSSNRKDRQRSIQLFSKEGKYNNKGHYVKYSDLAFGTKEGYIEDKGEVPYEPPSKKYTDFSSGPPAAFAKLMMGGKTGHEWPALTDLGVQAHESMGRVGPIYRCDKFNKATILIVAEQQSHDDLFCARALTGESGQRLQAFLKSAGITDDYVIIRVFGFDTLGLSQAKKNAIASNPQIVKVYQAILSAIVAKKKTKIVLSMGKTAQTLLSNINLNVANVIDMKSWKDSGSLADWQAALAQMKTIRYGKDIKKPSFEYNGEILQINRKDLPFGTLKWKGTSGDRARRANGKSNALMFKYYKLFIPDWAYKEKPRPLSKKEEKAISKHP